MISSHYDGSDSESERCSIPSLEPFIASDRSSQTSVSSIRSDSPAPSVWSMTSSMLHRAYRHEYGRGFNNYSEVYPLPADEEEHDRLDKQHEMFKAVIGKYPPPFEEVMTDDVPGEPKSVLDLGCGSGKWITEVARDYPHCSAVAVDLVPLQITSMPPNLRSEVDDINLGLEHFYGDFNVVHARLISAGIVDYQALVHHVSCVVRPGGLIDFYEFGYHIYDQCRRPIVVDTSSLGPPWLPRWMAFTCLAIRQRGGDTDAAFHLHNWIIQNGSFEQIVNNSFWIGASPWMSGDGPVMAQLRTFGEQMREDILAFLKSARPLLLGSGLDEAIVNELEDRATNELLEARIPYWIVVESTYARKRSDL